MLKLGTDSDPRILFPLLAESLFPFPSSLFALYLPIIDRCRSIDCNGICVLEEDVQGVEVLLFLYSRGKRCFYLLCLPFTIGHSDEFTVNVLNVQLVTMPGGMVNMCLGQVSFWNFPIW